VGLGRAAIRGTALAASANATVYAFSLVSTLILARLLTPTQFGQAALAITIAEFLFIVGGMSLPTALLREPESSVKVALQTSISLTALASVGVCAVGGLLVLCIATWGSDLVAALLATVVAARVPPLFALCLTSELQRRNAYGPFTLITYGSQAFSVAVALALGFSGAGAWALAGREVAAGGALFLLAVGLSRWSLTPGLDRTKARELLKFGVEMLGSRIGDLLFHRYDNLVVGSVGGTTQLGLYNQAYVLAEVGNRVYAPLIHQVPLSVYTQLQGDAERTERMYHLIMFVIVRSVVPIGVLMIALPDEILDVLFGPPWRPASGMLQALGAYAVLLPIFEHARVLLVAHGQVRATLRARVAQLAVLIPSMVPLVILDGGRGAGVAVGAAMLVGTAVIVSRANSLATFTLSGHVAPVVAGTVAGLAATVAAGVPNGHLAQLVAGVGGAIATYGLTLVMLEGRLLAKNLGTFALFLRRPSDTPTLRVD
jgi:O-antigen/teichoic acid export membrane protein